MRLYKKISDNILILGVQQTLSRLNQKEHQGQIHPSLYTC
jgi:hypothetical protein